VTVKDWYAIFVCSKKKEKYQTKLKPSLNMIGNWNRPLPAVTLHSTSKHGKVIWQPTIKQSILL